MAIQSSDSSGGTVKPKNKNKNIVGLSTGPAFTAEERKRFGVSPTGAIDQRTATAIMLERRGKKMGGASQEDVTSAENDAYESTLRSLSSSKGAGGGGSAGYGSMLDALKKLSTMSQGGVNQSMDALTQTLQQQANPFANFQAQQTQTGPDLAGLLQSQGVSADPLQQYAASINAQNQGQATAFQNLAGTLAGLQQQGMQGAVTDVGQQRADLLNQLQGNVLGVGAKLMGSKAIDRNAVVRMLLASMQNRA